MEKTNIQFKFVEMLYMNTPELTNNEQRDWWDELDAEAQASIERTLEDIRNGDVIPHEGVMKDYTKSLKPGNEQKESSFKDAFGAFDSSQSAEEIIEEIKASRIFNRENEEL